MQIVDRNFDGTPIYGVLIPKGPFGPLLEFKSKDVRLHEQRDGISTECDCTPTSRGFRWSDVMNAPEPGIRPPLEVIPVV